MKICKETLNTTWENVLGKKTFQKKDYHSEESRLKSVDSFTYLGSIVSMTGDTDEAVKARIRKARNAFLMMRNIWKWRNIRLQTELRLFNSNVRFSSTIYAQKRGEQVSTP